MKPSSKRFQPSAALQFLLPALLVILLVGLLASVAITTLSILGLMPSY